MEERQSLQVRHLERERRVDDEKAEVESAASTQRRRLRTSSEPYAAFLDEV